MTATTFPYLTTLVLVPAVGAAVVAAVPKRAVAAWFHEALGVAVTVLTLAVTAAVLFTFKSGVAGYQMVSQHEWASGLGIHWSVGIDGISLFLVVLTGVLFPLTMLGRGPGVTPGRSWPGSCCSRPPAWAVSSPST